MFARECQEIFMRLTLDTKHYTKECITLQKIDYCTGSSEPQDKSVDTLVIQQETRQELLLTTNKVQLMTKTLGQQHKTRIPSTAALTAQVGKIGTKETVLSQISSLGAENSSKSECAFRIEKPKMSKFCSDIRDYVIFKSDFKHLVETRYSKRDAIILLRASLQGKPLELIKGIGQDYDAAWE